MRSGRKCCAMPTSATGTAARISATATTRIQRTPRINSAAARKRPSMASTLSMASRLFPRCTDTTADSAVTRARRMDAVAARAPHRLTERAPRTLVNATAPSAAKPSTRNASCPHGCSEFDTHGVKPSTAIRVISAKRLEPCPPTTALALEWDDAILPPVRYLPAPKFPLSADLLHGQYSNSTTWSQLKKLY